MPKRLLENGLVRLLASGAARLLEVPTGTRKRLLENGLVRLLQSGTSRLIETSAPKGPAPPPQYRLLQNSLHRLLESGGSRLLEPGPASTARALSGGMRWGGTTAFVPPPLLTFRTTYIRQLLQTLDGVDLRISWVSLELPGTWYQIYVNGDLVHWTQHLYYHIPYPTTSTVVVVGAVPPLMASTDFSSILPTTPQRRIELTWMGGRYLGTDIAGFNVYLGSTPGAPVNFAKIVATVPAYGGSQANDGFGEGGFGAGGFGSAASTYEWISDHVAAGPWNVAIKSVDMVGNESSTALTGSVVVSGPPEPPLRDSGGSRLHYTYNATTKQVTLNWLASPSF